MIIKINKLFDVYKEHISKTPEVEKIFSLSKMSNEYDQLDYGFFPLGHGILKNVNLKRADAEMELGGIMVLGNDFGTIDYLNNIRPDGREKQNNPTIKNLQSLHITAFFTNFYMGVRLEGSNTDPINHDDNFAGFCNDFFIKQLEVLQPRLVVCLGKPVASVLYRFYRDQFSMIGKNINYGKIYNENQGDDYLIEANIKNTGPRKFMFIPHPSWAHVNWKNYNIEEKLARLFDNY